MFRNGWITRASDPITDSWLWATMWLVHIELRKLFTTEHLSSPLAVVILKAHFPLHWRHNIIADLLCRLLPSLLLPNTQQKQFKGGRIYFGFSSEGMDHLGREVLASRVGPS